MCYQFIAPLRMQQKSIQLLYIDGWCDGLASSTGVGGACACPASGAMVWRLPLWVGGIPAPVLQSGFYPTSGRAPSRPAAGVQCDFYLSLISCGSTMYVQTYSLPFRSLEFSLSLGSELCGSFTST